MTGARIQLAAVEHQTVDAIAGPLLTAEPLTGVGYAEPVEIIGPDGETRRGRVFEIDGDAQSARRNRIRTEIRLPARCS